MSNSKQAGGSVVAGTGFCVPERIVTNKYFESYLETSDDWIRERTGIVERRWVADNVGVSALAEPAARDAIERSGLSSDDIDGIVFATSTPDFAFPSSACVLQQRLGIPAGATAFDINAVCSGFVYAFSVADSLIRSGQCKNVVVVGADVFSNILNPNDRGTVVLFGDGAGAIVLTANDPKSDSGIYGHILGADGNHGDILCTPIGSAAPVSAESIAADAHYLKMSGREVFKLAVRKLGDINKDIVEKFGFSPDDISLFVSHQANKRILTATADRLGIDYDRVPMNLDKYGNTSAATIPILLAELDQQERLVRGELIALSAFGAGVTWGASLVRW
jgi:3-oxoacyl-[acyl-carrier-protein] synthase-3